MLKAAWKSLMGRKLRLLMSALSIVLGVMFVAGSLMFTDLLGATARQILNATVSDVNVTTAQNVGSGASTGMIDQKVVNEISALPGVSRVAGRVTNSTVYPLNADGRVITLGGAPGIATNFDDTPALDGAVGMTVVSGRAPKAFDEVTVDPGTLKRAGYAVGDTIKLAVPQGTREFKLVGTATFGDGATSGASYLFFTLETMRSIVPELAAGYSSLSIQTDPGTDKTALAEQIKPLLPQGFRAVDGKTLADEYEDQIGVRLGFVNTFLLVFAGISLLVATLLILNTFSIVVSQRSRELALLRALGAKRSQVRRTVLFEAVIVALIGAAFGLVLGYGLTWLLLWLMNSAGMGLGSVTPHLTWQTVTICVAVALVVTVIAALLPARRASRTRPVEAMAQAVSASPEGIGTPAWLGLGALQIGVAVLACGVFFEVPKRLWWVGGGVALTLIGAVLAAGVVGAPILWLAGRINSSIFGEVGRMATRNATRQPRRTAATAATLMIGLTLVSTVAILAATTTASVRHDLTKNQRGDFLLTSVNYQPFHVDVDAVGKVDGVDSVWTFSQTATQVSDYGSVMVTGTTPSGVKDGSATKILAGELLNTPGSVLLDYDLSRDAGLPMGKRFTVPGIDGSEVELLVTGIIDESDARMITNSATYPKLGDATQYNIIKVAVTSGADRASIKKALTDATSDYPLVSVVDNDEYIADQLAGFNNLLALIYGLLALAIVISILGIVNTLGLSVIERTREIGLLRAVGLTRRQLRRMVRLEAVAVAVLGAILGVTLGLLFGYSLTRVIDDLSTLSIPWLQLVIFVVVAGIVGMFAAIIPARRASRLNVLDAIATE